MQQRQGNRYSSIVRNYLSIIFLRSAGVMQTFRVLIKDASGTSVLDRLFYLDSTKTKEDVMQALLNTYAFKLSEPLIRSAIITLVGAKAFVDV